MSFDKHYVGYDLMGCENHGLYRAVTGVKLTGGETDIMAGDDSGLVLEAKCPYATQSMAEALLEELYGFQYQAFSATSAGLDPAAEMGDGVTVEGFYGAISSIDDDGSGYPSIATPGEASTDEEYPVIGVLSVNSSEINEINEQIDGINLDLDDINLNLDDINLQLDGIDTTLGDIGLELDSLNDRINDVQSSLEMHTTTATVTGLAAGYSKTVPAEGLPDGAHIVVVPDPASWPTAMLLGVYCSGQGDGTLTFSRVVTGDSNPVVDSTPANATFNVLYWLGDET